MASGQHRLHAVALALCVACGGQSSVAGGPGSGAPSSDDGPAPVLASLGPELTAGRLEEVELLGSLQCETPVGIPAAVHTALVADVDGDGLDEVLLVDDEISLVVIRSGADPADPCGWGEVLHRVSLVSEPIAKVFAYEALANLVGAVTPEDTRIHVLPDRRSMRIDVAIVPDAADIGPEPGLYGYLFVSSLVTWDEKPILAASSAATSSSEQVESLVFWTTRSGEGHLESIKATWSVHPQLPLLSAWFVRDGDGFRAETEATWWGWGEWIDMIVEAHPLDTQTMIDVQGSLASVFPVARVDELDGLLRSMALSACEMLGEDGQHKAAHDMAYELGLVGEGFDDPQLEARRLALVAELPSLVAGGWQAVAQQLETEMEIGELYWHPGGDLLFLTGGDWHIYTDGEVKPLQGELLEVMLEEARPSWRSPKYKWQLSFDLVAPQDCDEGEPSIYGILDICKKKSPARCNTHVFVDSGNAPFPWTAEEAPAGIDAIDVVAFGPKYRVLIGRKNLLMRFTLVPVPEKKTAEAVDPCSPEIVDTFDGVDILSDMAEHMQDVVGTPYSKDGLGYLFGDEGGVWLGSFQPDYPAHLIVPMSEKVVTALWSPDSTRIAIVDSTGKLHVATVAAPGPSTITLEESEIY